MKMLHVTMPRCTNHNPTSNHKGNTMQPQPTTQAAQDINGKPCMQDGQGRWVPVETIKPIDMMRDEFVREKFAQIIALNEQMKKLKDSLFEDTAAFVSVSGAEYGVKMGGKKGNVSLTTFDGSMMIKRQMSDIITFDERLQAAKELIDQCLHEWTTDARAELKAIVDRAFEVDKEGNISTARVLALRRTESNDERWIRAMQAISDSIQCTGTKPYIRAYLRDENGKYQPISLDMASV
jgi:hypothetical protein